jgi:hypothetical protein
MMGKSLRAVKKVLDNLNTEGRTVGLIINESKNKLIIPRRRRRRKKRASKTADQPW